MAPYPTPIERPDSAVLREAAEWLLRMQEGPLSPEEQQALDSWRAHSPLHAAAWQRAEKLQRALSGIPPKLGMRVLGDDRRVALKALSLALASGSVATLSWQFLPWEGWLADHRTAVGERRTVALVDGSTLHLNTDSAVDVRFDTRERRLLLQRGEIHVETAPDSSHRPLVVDVEHGRMRALGTRFTVRRDAQATYLGVSEGAVEVRPADAPGHALIIEGGSETFFGHDRASPPRPLDDNALAWLEGTLYADHMPLRQFIDLLSRYRSGVLRCDPAVADMAISGAFQLDDPDRILDSLQRTRPLRIVWRTRYWGLIQAAG